MEVYRLSRRNYADSLSGIGASIKGTRWNSIGMEMIYCAGNRSLAMAEVLVHFTLGTLPDDYVLLTIYIPDDIGIKKLTVEELPENWNTFPHPVETQKIGDDFIHQKKYCILQIPSSVTKGGFNFLINPLHQDFKKIKIIDREDFPFDNRLFK